MSDNVTTQSSTLATVPASTKIATDEDATNGHVQIVKLAISTDGSATPLTADNTDGLLVNLGSNNDVALATLPDTAAGDLAAINAALGGTLTVDLGANNDVTLATLPDTAAGDLAAINTAVSGTLTVGSHAVTNAGTFVVQEDGAALTALQLIDDIVATLGTTTYTETTTKGAVVGAVRNDTLAALADTDNEIAPLQVNASGALYVDGSDVTQPISAAALPLPSGAATAANQSTGNTSLGTIAGAVSGTEMQVDIVSDGAGLLTTAAYDAAFGTAGSADTQVRTVQGIASMTPLLVDATGQGDVPITLAGESVAVTNAGTFATQVDGDALTALQLIDDAIYADDADWTADTSKHALVGGVTQSVPSANTDGDTTPLVTNLLRELRLAALESDLAAASTSHTHKYYTAAAPTDGIIWSPAAGKRWYLTHLSINVSAASTVTVEDDLAGGDDPIYKAEFAANSGVVLTFPEVPLFSGEDAADLTITATAGTVYVTAVGYEI